MTKIFLAATSHIKSPIVGKHKPHYLLESFLDLKSKSKKTDEYVKWCLTADSFLLDSGAFAFMNKAAKTKNLSEDDINKYVDDYIAFINKWDIKNFFEMDVDCVLGYDKVKEIRNKIENQTGKKCIPVWHITRGMEEFHKMCSEYSYVAVGGIASKEIPKKDHHILKELCDIAHSYGCKVHGLGYLPLQILNDKECPFDTVDGTAWQGHMRAQKFMLDNNKIVKTKDEAMAKKERTWKECASECFKTWTEFSKIVEEGDAN